MSLSMDEELSLMTAEAVMRNFYRHWASYIHTALDHPEYFLSVNRETALDGAPWIHEAAANASLAGVGDFLAQWPGSAAAEAIRDARCVALKVAGRVREAVASYVAMANARDIGEASADQFRQEVLGLQDEIVLEHLKPVSDNEW